MSLKSVELGADVCRCVQRQATHDRVKDEAAMERLGCQDFSEDTVDIGNIPDNMSVG